MTSRFLKLPALPALLAVVFGTLTVGASAHDTWFERLPRGADGELRLALGTGDNFPRIEYAVEYLHLDRMGCRSTSGVQTGLTVFDPSTLTVTLKPDGPLPADRPASCWAQLKRFDVQLDNDTAERYLDEVRLPPEVRAVWTAQRQRGVPWQEVYVKHMRIEVEAGEASATAPITAPMTTPVAAPLGLDAVLQPERQPVRAGDTVAVQLLRDGQPLPRLWVEFRSTASRLTVWRQADEQGRVSARLPFSGTWMMRGIDLRPPAPGSEVWTSRFITLTFQVAAR
jgi:Domain of unknown function (DUF4198)